MFGSHDRFGGTDFCLNPYVVWSAAVSNLADWRCEGESYRAEQDPLCSASGGRLFAPDVQRGADGRWYLYYALDFTGVIGVAVASRPAGPYAFYAHVQYEDGQLLGRRPGDPFVYDPAVLADDDGRVYLYAGFCPTDGMGPRFAAMHLNRQGCTVTELAPDMYTVRRGPQAVLPWKKDSAGTDFAEHPFFEAPSIRKAGTRYYLLYSSAWSHELCCAFSGRPDEGFRFGGTVVSNGDIGFHGNREPLNYTGTNHGGIEQIDGNWYVFYHRQTGGTPYARQGCAEKIQILPEGGILQVQMTSCGLNGGPLPGEGWYPAYIACCLMSGNGAVPYLPKTRVGAEHPYFTQAEPDGSKTAVQYIAGMRAGAQAGFRTFAVQGPTAVSVQIRAEGKGRLLLSTAQHGSAAAVFEILPAEGVRVVQGKGCLPAGLQDLWFTYYGAGKLDFYAFALAPKPRT